MPIDADGRFAAPEGLRRGRAGCLGTFSWGRAAPGCGDGDLPLNTGAMPDRRIGPPQAERPREAGRRFVAPAPAFRDPLDIIAAPEFDGEVPEQEEESPT